MNNSNKLQIDILQEEVKRLVRTEKRLYSLTQQYDKEINDYQKLNALIYMMNPVYNLDSLCKLVVDSMIKDFKFEKSMIFLNTNEVLNINNSCGFQDDEIKKISSIKIKVTKPQIVKLKKFKAALRIIDNDIQFNPITKISNWKSLFICPLISQSEHLIGILVTGYTSEKAIIYEKYASKDVTLLTNLSAHVSSTIERVDLINNIKLLEKDKYYMVGILSSGIAHEILNPLTGVKGTADYILSEIKDNPIYKNTDVREAFTIMFNQIDKIKSIVKNIRLIIYGKQRAYEMVDLYSVVNSIVETYSPRIEKKIILENNIPLDFKIYTNHSSITHILMNLISNSVESIKAGKTNGKVSIFAGGGKKKYFIKVTDNGVGIEKDNLNKIYDINFSTKNVYSGTGYGLFLVKELASKLNITIKIESEKSCGTTFSLYHGM